MSENSSFDPLDYYQKLTLCLASKKNCKVNLSKLPGGKEIKENKRFQTKKVTNQKLQTKFLANYLQKCQPQPNELHKNQPTSVPTNLLGFKLKEANENGKRKKNSEDLILPPDYFKSVIVPDLSLFKVPAVPPLPKKARTQEIPEVVEEKNKNTTNNFTLESLFSGNFKPPISSTPNKKPLAKAEPIICDPTDILKSIKESRARNVIDDKQKSFIQMIESAAIQIDSSCYSEMVDPTVEILNRLRKTHQIASQDPRKSFIEKEFSPLQSLTTTTSSVSPVFFERQGDLLGETKELDIFNDTFNQTFASMSIFPNIRDDIERDLFLTPPRTQASSSTSINDSFAPSVRNVSQNMQFNWLEDIFNSTSDYIWDDNDLAAKSNDFIFRSPPSRSSLRRKKESQAQFDEDLEFDKSLFKSDSAIEASFWKDLDQSAAFQFKNYDNIFFDESLL